MGAVGIGAIIPATPVAHALGFQPLPGTFYLALALMVGVYLALIEAGKRWFYRTGVSVPAARSRRTGHRVHRRAARFSADGERDG